MQIEPLEVAMEVEVGMAASNQAANTVQVWPSLSTYMLQTKYWETDKGCNTWALVVRV